MPGVESVASPYSKEGASQISRDGDRRVRQRRPGRCSPPRSPRPTPRTSSRRPSPRMGRMSASPSAGQSIESSERSGAGLSEGRRCDRRPDHLASRVRRRAVLFIDAAVDGHRRPGHRHRRSSVCSPTSSTWPACPPISPSSSASVSGVDYGLFIISRHRSAVKAGLSYEDAVAQAVNTSGRAVLFAGITVCIALLGQFALGRHLPLRAVGLSRYRSGPDHGDVAHLPAGHARVPRDRKSSPAGNAGR